MPAKKPVKKMRKLSIGDLISRTSSTEFLGIGGVERRIFTKTELRSIRDARAKLLIGGMKKSEVNKILKSQVNQLKRNRAATFRGH